MKKVVVGISGGVDSSVSAYLLKKQGYDVIGVFMQNWDPYINNEKTFDNKNDESGLNVCSAEYDFSIASKVCEQLNISLHRVNFINEYWDRVFEPFLEDYKNGLTPNPDILCNKYIKFGSFHDYCFKNFNCDYIATGHYAGVRLNKSNNLYELTESFDQDKDQTYFLCSLSQKQLSKTLFPLSNISKKDVRDIANKINLNNWDRKDSTGICFIGERNFKDFLRNYIENKPGKIIDIDSKKIVGNHDGIHLYTIGQRKGLNLSGNTYKYFVAKKDIENNILYVSDDKMKEKYLDSNFAICKSFNWISYIPSNNNVEIRFRHTKNKVKGRFHIQSDNSIMFSYDESKAVTSGQYLVIYQNGVCLGGGPVSQVLMNY